MREIRFRVWNTKIKKMCNPFCSSHGDITFINIGIEEIQTGGREILMQYTGLKDKNGRNIYEGDIVRYFNDFEDEKPEDEDFKKAEVRFDNEVCGFFPFSYYDKDCNRYVRNEYTEIIGNIYENPELLK